MNSKKNVLVTTSSFAKQSSEAMDRLKRNGFEVELNPHGRKLKEEELVELLEKNKPIGVLAGTEKISRATLEKARDYLKSISRIGVGWNNIDHEAAREFGIKVLRTAGVLDQAVGELTLGLILNALRQLSCHDRNIRQGRWEKFMGALLHGKIVGILGFGSIGKYVGQLVDAFGAGVIYYDPESKQSDFAKAVSFEDLLMQTDILTIHASAETELLDKENLNKFAKPNAILINTARGKVVDEEALYELLAENKIAFASLDVFRKEPYKGKLKELDNILLTPHIGSYAKEARVKMEILAVENLLSALGRE